MKSLRPNYFIFIIWGGGGGGGEGVQANPLNSFWICHCAIIWGRVAQSVTCVATDASLTADLGVASLIPAQSHTSVEIDHEKISRVILLPSAFIQERLLSITSESMCTMNWLTACSSLPSKKYG